MPPCGVSKIISQDPELASLGTILAAALSPSTPDAAAEPLLAALASRPWLRGAARARAAARSPTPLQAHPLAAVGAAVGRALAPERGSAVRKAALLALQAWLRAAEAAGLRVSPAAGAAAAASSGGASESEAAAADADADADAPFPMAATSAQSADGETDIRSLALTALTAAVCARCCGPRGCAAAAAAAACARLDDASDPIRGQAADSLARMAPYLPPEVVSRSLEAASAAHRLGPDSDLSQESRAALERCRAALEGAPAAAAALAAAEEEEAKSWAWVAHEEAGAGPAAAEEQEGGGAGSAAGADASNRAPHGTNDAEEGRRPGAAEAAAAAKGGEKKQEKQQGAASGEDAGEEATELFSLD